ncbi:MAG: hypothetical protein GIX02_12020 [Candidatus Eremiobacteraeota bacterium]|nr:hypothetical protein [Candidatus Eremiobacteraeota bacterium]
MHALESRVSRLEGAFEQIADRLTSIDSRFASVDVHLGEIRASIRWLGGLMATAWVTIIVSVWLRH